MLADGTIVIDLLRPALARRTYAPSDPKYADVLRHLGGLAVGEQKLVPPWPDRFDAARVEGAVHAYVASTSTRPATRSCASWLSNRATTISTTWRSPPR
jgi:hypothetical protein